MLASQPLSVLDAFGHVSVRSRTNPNRFYISRYVAPGIVTAADIIQNDLDSKPVTGERNDQYQERFLHGEIYKARPDVMRYGTVEGPGLIQLNMAISRTFGLGEKRTLQLRGEAFNLPNHMNPLIIPANLSVNSAQFGRVQADQQGITSSVGGVTAGDYRVIQLALKLAF